MKRLTLLVALVPMLAFAGKTEREYWKNTVEPAMKDAATTYKKACGCDLKVTIGDSVKKSEEFMGNARWVCTSITENAPKYCNDDASKAAMCKMTALDIQADTKGETDFRFDEKAKKGFVTLVGSSYVDFDRISKTIDK